MLTTRIAPTPSGYIHLGNAFNFSLINDLAQSRQAKLHLRIDDFDPERSRPEYVQDIFTSLEWLKIRPDCGPSSPDDFYQNYSMQKKQEVYWSHAYELLNKNLAYACDCSRSQKDKFSPQGAYLGNCRDRGLSFIKGKHSLRLRCPILISTHKLATPVNTFENSKFFLDNFYWTQTLNDFVLWTKEDFAAYQLVSVIEDALLQTSFMVRGEDLADSTGAQYYLAKSLGGIFEAAFSQMDVLHHSLVKDAKNPSQKFSKSDGTHSLKQMVATGYAFQDFKTAYKSFFSSLL